MQQTAAFATPCPALLPLQVTIVTGRPHQIRIHMAAMGHPLVGDPLYAAGGVPPAPHDATVTAETEVPVVLPGEHGRRLVGGGTVACSAMHPFAADCHVTMHPLHQT
jgi:hypothetical protein